MANKKITDLMSGTPVRDSLLESAIDISGTMDSRKVKAGLVADLASANVAAPYDETVTYAIDRYCLYEGNTYRCIAITTGAFDSTKWTQIVVTDEFRRVVELTSAQYSALSSAEKNNGTLYILTDEETTAADIPYSAGVSVADKLDSLSTYSTTEQAVGTWTDGKTIYQKTITQNITQGTYADFDFNVNSDDIIDVNVIGHKSNNIWFKAPIRNEVGSTYYQLYFFVNTANNETHVAVLGESSTSNYFDCECTVTLRYTKA